LVLRSDVVSKEKDEIDDGEYSDLPPTDQLSPDEDLRGRIIGPPTDPNKEPTRIELTTTEFLLDGLSGPQDIIEEEEDRIPDNHVAEVLRLHYKFDHLPIPKLQQMAKQGVLPKILANCAAPTCSACLFAKAQRKPWRSKTARNYQSPELPKRPGQVVSVDQFKSPTPVLIAQMTGILTTKRYVHATVFIDQYSRLGYVHLQKTQDVTETLEEKKAFERFAATHGVKVENYLADNGIFRANKWMELCQKKVKE
jgi:hypothetical protein